MSAAVRQFDEGSKFQQDFQRVQEQGLDRSNQSFNDFLILSLEEHHTPHALRRTVILSKLLGDPFLLPKALSYLKAEIKSAALSIWQDNWDNGETGRSTHDIVPRVSNKPVGWNREEIMFVTGYGPFLSYLLRFNLRTHDNCSCGEKGDPIHYATKCPFTLSWHFQTSTVSFKL
ncbi:hypothetical protein AVEN_228755-1 [Araneus ventricosus]|uniref:Uncharacterized protein n=1 Tax=Araneus ventricosus TaxID=182803 RepID=A0A4Y2GJJ0_ARAVE|nr:hypothetical protein AVEN_228755-1 [Araneus ventricosus]